MSPDDKGSLHAIQKLLKPGGALLLTVPINPWMWSAHDVAHHHHRRYRKQEIRKLAEDAGYSIDLLSPFNSLLFPPIAAVRLFGKLTGKDDSDDAMPSPVVNKVLDGVFGLERGPYRPVADAVRRVACRCSSSISVIGIFSSRMESLVAQIGRQSLTQLRGIGRISTSHK